MAEISQYINGAGSGTPSGVLLSVPTLEAQVRGPSPVSRGCWCLCLSPPLRFSPSSQLKETRAGRWEKWVCSAGTGPPQLSWQEERAREGAGGRAQI